MGQTSKEIYVDPKKMIISRTDLKGIIEYANKDFMDISGYSLEELINSPHNIVRHPDMPAVIFRLMWKRIQLSQDIFAIVKNRSKNGNYYWVTTKFDIRRNPLDNKVTGYIAYRQGADKKLVSEITELYNELLLIENASGIDASEKYLIGFLETKNMTYDQYIDHIVGKGGLFKSFFKKMASAFGN
ncbi:PAS domain-containing protein [Sulfuricurvum sp.]|uniref:PAS domain-containing protein n=1 Tax=Sulfuricurvum sp. TaxID=2025608 RepID=UPI002E3662D9|nr:PAS domain-containing protein [Sulfuricurvum sp.]HEX5330642.1 PAS domain-containing protein [Sulfuricurvum sp.]